MPLHEVTVECPINKTFRVEKVLGMFDVPPAEKAAQTFRVEVPGIEEDWDIGVIVGPSGSGKSTIARHVYGKQLYAGHRWPKDVAIIDALGEGEVGNLCGMLTAVGFSSPPAWIRPYHTLSNGQQFRADLARALLSDSPLVAFDEFTSVVDRQVAKIGSAAVAKAIRRGTVKRKFVAVTCHYDIVDWLEPDWVLDMASGALARRRLRRPSLALQIRRGTGALWPHFAQHHYLSGTLARSARCYYGMIGSRAVALCAFLPSFGQQNMRRVTRLVVLPDYQGIGIGGTFLSECAALVAAEGFRVNISSSHPAMIGFLERSPLWRVTRVLKNGSPPTTHLRGGVGAISSAGRAVVAATFVG